LTIWAIVDLTNAGFDPGYSPLAEQRI